MRRLHLALSTDRIEATVADYSARLGAPPRVHVEGEYALWRTDTLNLSVRRDATRPPGQLRHLGWEDPDAECFSQDTDVNGITWERFSSEQQAREIDELWPASADRARTDGWSDSRGLI